MNGVNRSRKREWSVLKKLMATHGWSLNSIGRLQWGGVGKRVKNTSGIHCDSPTGSNLAIKINCKSPQV